MQPEERRPREREREREAGVTNDAIFAPGLAGLGVLRAKEADKEGFSRLGEVSNSAVKVARGVHTHNLHGFQREREKEEKVGSSEPLTYLMAFRGSITSPLALKQGKSHGCEGKTGVH